MGFARNNAERSAALPKRGVLWVCERILGRIISFAFMMLVVAVVAAGVLYARLTMGPVELPGVAKSISEYLSSNNDTYDLKIASIELSLGQGSAPAGVQFTDVEARAPDGSLLMHAPRVVARLLISDLLQGDILPTRVTLIRPGIEVRRASDGRMRIGLATGEDLDRISAGEDEGIQSPARFDAIARVMDGFTGDLQQVEQLAKLERIAIIGIDLLYSDDVLRQTWRTQNANIRIWRTAEGSEARLNATIGEKAGSSIPLQLSASRKRGTRTTDIELRFENLTPAAVSSEIPGMKISDAIDAKLSGFTSLTLLNDGNVENFSGVLRAETGRITLDGGPTETFDRAELAFRHDPGSGRIMVDGLSVSAPALDASFRGFVDIDGGEGDSINALAAQLSVDSLRLDMPEIFSNTIQFDGGQITGRLDLDGDPSFKVKNSFLTLEDLILAVDGDVRVRDGAWLTDIRATGKNVSVEAVMNHWPLAAAVNARDWIDQNITTGQVDQLLSHLRIAEGEPQLSLDFEFSDLSSQYIPGMSPIQNAAGSGHLTLHDFYLFMDEGQVEPIGGEPIALGGSSLVFRDLWGAITPTEVSLSGGGDLTAILTLIDQDPLNLVGKLDLAPDAITGSAAVDAFFTFPLLNDLLLGQIYANVAADLSDVSMSFPISGEVLRVTGDRIALTGSVEEMTLQGDVAVDGKPITLDWTESYGKGANHREVRVGGLITPAVLADLGHTVPSFTAGSVETKVAILQAGFEFADFTVEADLTKAALDVGELGWSKDPGQAGRLDVVGIVGSKVSIQDFALVSNGLDIQGSIALTEEMDLERAQFDRVILDDKLDISATLTPDGTGISIDVTGNWIDVGILLEGDDEEEPSSDRAPFVARFAVETLFISEGRELTGATGTYRHAGLDASAQMTGGLGTSAKIQLAYDKSGGAPGQLSITSAQAGQMLGYFGIYPGATNGELTLNASLDAKPGEEASGILKIRGLTLDKGEGLRNVLRTGRFADEQVEEVSSGLVFRSIRVPFVYADGQINIGESFAKSPSLAITATGQLSREDDRIDLVGVISPAYGLTSAIDDVPVLGRLITGGEGKGIFGMTFSLRGPLGDPEVAVNPLSLLTPGILRGVFSSSGSKPSGDLEGRFRKDDR